MTQRPTWRHVIGIMGGLGPYAHVEFETLLLQATATALGRSPADQDYPPWVLSSMPTTPDRTRALLESGASPIDALVQSAGRLKDADFAVIPCNTAHAFVDELRKKVPLPILDMIRVTAQAALEKTGRAGTIGILAATGTLQIGLYPDRIREVSPEAKTITPLDLPDGEALQRELVMEPIFGERGIKAGAFHDPGRKEELAAPMREAARRLGEAGAEVVLTACTEIPLVLGRDSVDGLALIDPMAVAAGRSIEIALGRSPLP